MEKEQPTLTKRGEKRRQAIMDASKDLFLANGFDGTSLEMIISQAGGSRRSVYQYFGGKEGLFGAIISDSTDEFLTLLDDAEFRNLPPREALTSLATKFLRFLLKPDMLALFRVVVGESTRFPELGKVLHQAADNAHDKLADYLRLQTAKGLIQAPDPELMARHFFSMVKGDLHFQATIIPDIDFPDQAIEAYIHSSVDLFLKGIAPTPPGTP